MAGEPELVENHTDDDTGGYVTYLQQMLQHHGYYTDGQVDGIFGPITDAAVRQFQQDNGLTVDGWVGPITWGVLTGESDAGGGDSGTDATTDTGDGGTGEQVIEIDLNDYPALQRVYEAYLQSGDNEEAGADILLAMVGVNPEGLDTDDDGDTAYA